MKETKRYYFTPKELRQLLLPQVPPGAFIHVYARVNDFEYSIEQLTLEVTE